MIPKYPYTVYIQERIGLNNSKLHEMAKAFESIGAAMDYRNAMVRKTLMHKVRVQVDLDVWTQGDNGKP